LVSRDITIKIRGITLAETRTRSLVIQRAEGGASVAVSSPPAPPHTLSSSKLEIPWKLLEPKTGVTVFSSP